MSKKIYTVTFHNANNYGAVLQAYALQQVLTRKYDAQILDYANPVISNDYRLFKKERGTRKQKTIRFIKDIINLKKNILSNYNFWKFRKKYLRTTCRFADSQSIKSSYPKGDVYITGSDQVWNPIITKGLDDIYTLNFGHGDFRKISYAASAGNSSTLQSCIDTLVECLKLYCAVSVRECSLNRLLSEASVNDVETVLDPVLLLSCREWQRIISRNRLTKQKYIFVYSWDEPECFFRIVNRLAELTGFKIYHYHRYDYKHLFHKKKASYYGCNPGAFLSLIQNAEYVVTTSFHGTALASVFNKKMFVVLANYSDRIMTLLKTFGLSDRIVSSEEEFEAVFHEKIDWERVNQSIKQEQCRSLQWLYKMIDEE